LIVCCVACCSTLHQRNEALVILSRKMPNLEELPLRTCGATEAHPPSHSVSYNMGKTWTAALVAPTHTAGLGGGAGVGKPGLEHAVWSPVLHCDRTTGRMHLFYTESTACWRPTSPPTWEPGGDVRLLTLEGLHQGAGKALTWSTPRTLLEERTDGVPKVRPAAYQPTSPAAETLASYDHLISLSARE
jgi:hypothetical protein